ncbi:MAG: hypothetical protein ABIG84_02840 [archaeon]
MAKDKLDVDASKAHKGLVEKLNKFEREKEDIAKFRLRDSNMTAEAAQGTRTRWGDVNLGKCALVQGLDQGAENVKGHGVDLNPTTVFGGTQNMYYGLMFETNKDGWTKNKIEEWIEASHAHPDFHQMIAVQKALYEDKIKQGLANISQSVADLELLEHDIRKYEEYQEYLENLDSSDPKNKRSAMFAIKTIFVDQVDFHAGGGGQGAGRLSLAFMRNNNIMPTIVNDFLVMESLEDIRDGGKFANMADVEKKMLESKWTLYQHWLGVFRSAIMQRLERLKILQRSREFTIDQYRAWLKPIIARHRLLETGYAKDKRDSNLPLTGRRDIRRHHAHSISIGVSAHGVTAWVHKALTNPEMHTYPAEIISKAVLDGEFGKVFAYDEWTQDNLIFDTEHGLLADYPWLRKDWVDEKAKSISDTLNGNLPKLYYSFLRLDMLKFVMKMPTGPAIEDTDFLFNMYVLSANVMLVKLLEMQAKDEELERYIDKVLGLDPKMNKYDGIVLGYKKKGFGYEVDGKKFKTKKEMLKAYPEPAYYLTPLKSDSKFWKGIKDLFGLDIWLFRKRGPYEHQFYDRYTKFYLKLSGERFASLVNMVERRMRIEEPS